MGQIAGKGNGEINRERKGRKVSKVNVKGIRYKVQELR